MFKNFIRYSDTPSEEIFNGKLEIFIAHGDGYLRYTLKRISEAKTNADCYVIDNAAYVDSLLNTVEVLTTPGEWEMAVHMKGRPDFFGGRMHGDEIMDRISFFADGVCVEVIGSNVDTYFDKLTIVETSDIYDPQDHIAIVARHGKEYIFSGNKLTISQYLDWGVDCELSSSYMAMFPVSKKVTDRFYTNRDLCPRDIVFDRYDGVTSVFSYGEKFGARFSVEKYTKPDCDVTFLLTDNNGGRYNKQYFIAAKEGDSVRLGDRWETATVYELNYKP